VSRSNAKPGFTILELLIALTLVTTLMMLCWSLLSTFSRLENRSRRTVATLEITRSLRRQMQNDLDQLFFVSKKKQTAEPASIDNSFENGFLVESSLQKNSPSLLDSIMNSSVDKSPDPANDLLPDSFLFEGSNESFSVLIRNDGSSRFFGPNEDFLVITYQWRDQQFESRDPELDEEVELEREGFGNKQEKQIQPRDFVRSVVTYHDFQRRIPFDSSLSRNRRPGVPMADFETIEINATNDDRSNSLGPIREQIDRIPEITMVGFRYFDGKTWRSSWSPSDPTVPLAIEVNFTAEMETEFNDFDSSDEVEEIEFDEEFEIDNDRDSEFETSSLDAEVPRLDLIENFDPESKRFLIRIGIRENDPDFRFDGEVSPFGMGSDFEGFE
jgi:prepilin-type N-terminal cleavage/methylation domain-containing protein